MSCGKLENKLEINVNISDIILTPLTCGVFITEILKGLLYKRCQIPYPYSWLKTVVNKRREKSENVDIKNHINFTAENHFRIVSTAYDTLEEILENLIAEFRNGTNIKEIVVVFGSTPHCPKEVYRINISCLSKRHFDRIHDNHFSKYQQKLLRKVFLSQQWMDTIDATLPCTNTYIFLKKDVLEKENGGTECEGFFIYSKPLTFPPSTKQIVINLNYLYDGDDTCCDNLMIFEEETESTCDVAKKRKISNETLPSKLGEITVWCQAKDLLKGFKDCYVNKVSVCEIW